MPGTGKGAEGFCNNPPLVYLEAFLSPCGKKSGTAAFDKITDVEGLLNQCEIFCLFLIKNELYLSRSVPYVGKKNAPLITGSKNAPD